MFLYTFSENICSVCFHKLELIAGFCQELGSAVLKGVESRDYRIEIVLVCCIKNRQHPSESIPKQSTIQI